MAVLTTEGFQEAQPSCLDLFSLHDDMCGKRSKIYVKAKIKHADGHNLQATEYVGAINKLDACHFYTSPGLAWQAALKMVEFV